VSSNSANIASAETETFDESAIPRLTILIPKLTHAPAMALNTSVVHVEDGNANRGQHPLLQNVARTSPNPNRHHAAS
jgi:hypothetical protein